MGVAQLLSWEGERAEESYRFALDLADRLGMRLLRAHCYLGLGRLSRRSEKHDADAHLRSALTMYNDLDMPFWLEKAQAEISKETT